MRATVSHLVRFEGTFVPDADVIGEPGGYLREGWQTAFIPHYAASFLGAAEAAYDYALEYLVHQGKGGDPYVQQRVGSMLVNVETAHLWLRVRRAACGTAATASEAQLAGSRARHVIEHLAEQTVHHCIRACGARSLVRPSPIERDPARPHLLPAPRQRRPHPGDDRPGRARARPTTRRSTSPDRSNHRVRSRATARAAVAGTGADRRPARLPAPVPERVPPALRRRGRDANAVRPAVRDGLRRGDRRRAVPGAARARLRRCRQCPPPSRCTASRRCCCWTGPSTCASAASCRRRSTASGCAPTSG